MKSKYRLGILSIIAVSLLIIQGVMIWQKTANIGAQLVDPLIYISISPKENLKIRAGDSIIFNVKGIYTSSIVPVKANWFTVQNGLIHKLDNCNLTDMCKITAGDTADTMFVRASVKVDDELKDEIMVTVDRSNVHQSAGQISTPKVIPSTQKINNKVPTVTVPVLNKSVVKIPLVRKQQIRRNTVRRPAIQNKPFLRRFINRVKSRRWLR